MLKLTNLKIKYGEHIVIDNGKLELNPGDLCLISGDSGTGKSSLLDILAVQGKSNHEFDYYWKNEYVNDFDDKRKSSFLLNEVACVTQNNLIFGEFTVSENLESFSEIGYGNIQKELIDNLINQLGLSKLLDKKAKKLSGGEKQRVAIACAVLKNADLYLFDEPTSMVDIDRKEAVFELLKELANKGKIIVVVSHELDKSLFNKVYRIKNKELVQEKDNINIKLSYEHSTHSNVKNIVSKLSNKFFFSQPLINSLYVTIISICIALIINIIGGAYASITDQKKLAEIVNNPELLVVNTETMIFCEADEFGAHPISDDDFRKIQSIDGIVEARRYIYFPSDSGIRESLSSDVASRLRMEEYTISLKVGGETVKTFNYLTEFSSDYAVYPAYNHQNIDEKCISLTDGDGIYITARIANLLEITELDNQVINLTFSVPIGNEPGYFTDGATGEESKRRFMYGVFVNMDFPIKGIIEDIDYYSYMHMYNPDFFLHIDTIESIQEEYFNKYENLLLTLSKKNMPWPDFKKYYATRIVDPGIWESSAIVVHVSDNDVINQVISEITKLNPNLSVAIKSYGMVEVDTKMTLNVCKTALGYSLIILFVIFVSISILKAYRRKSRKAEFELLKKNGFNYKLLTEIEAKENKLEVFIMSIISILMVVLIYYILTRMLYMKISLSIWMLLILVVIVECSVFGGNEISKKIVKNS